MSWNSCFSIQVPHDPVLNTDHNCTAIVFHYFVDIQSRNVPILLLANKSDLRDAMTPVQCSKHLELDKLREVSYHIW